MGGMEGRERGWRKKGEKSTVKRYGETIEIEEWHLLISPFSLSLRFSSFVSKLHT